MQQYASFSRGDAVICPWRFMTLLQTITVDVRECRQKHLLCSTPEAEGVAAKIWFGCWSKSCWVPDMAPNQVQQIQIFGRPF
jgi:hypothetical protein